MIILGGRLSSRCLQLLGGGGGGDTSLRHPMLASVTAVMRGNYERGKGNINVLVPRSLGLTLFMLYVILI